MYACLKVNKYIYKSDDTVRGSICFFFYFVLLFLIIFLIFFTHMCYKHTYVCTKNSALKMIRKLLGISAYLTLLYFFSTFIRGLRRQQLVQFFSAFSSYFLFLLQININNFCCIFYFYVYFFYFIFLNYCSDIHLSFISYLYRNLVYLI